MYTLKDLKKYCAKKIKANPNLQDEISEFYFMAVEEVRGGGSESWEVELAVRDIDDLVDGLLQDV